MPKVTNRSIVAIATANSNITLMEGIDTASVKKSSISTPPTTFVIFIIAQRLVWTGLVEGRTSDQLDWQHLETDNCLSL